MLFLQLLFFFLSATSFFIFLFATTHFYALYSPDLSVYYRSPLLRAPSLLLRRLFFTSRTAILFPFPSLVRVHYIPFTVFTRYVFFFVFDFNLSVVLIVNLRSPLYTDIRLTPKLLFSSYEFGFLALLFFVQTQALVRVDA